MKDVDNLGHTPWRSGAKQDWQDKSPEERLATLAKHWQCPMNADGTLTLVGRYERSNSLDKNGKPYGFFVDLRDQDGDLLYLPQQLGKPKVWARDNHKWAGSYWTLKVNISKIGGVIRFPLSWQARS